MPRPRMGSTRSVGVGLSATMRRNATLAGARAQRVRVSRSTAFATVSSAQRGRSASIGTRRTPPQAGEPQSAVRTWPRHLPSAVGRTRRRSSSRFRLNGRERSVSCAGPATARAVGRPWKAAQAAGHRADGVSASGSTMPAAGTEAGASGVPGVIVGARAVSGRTSARSRCSGGVRWFAPDRAGAAHRRFAINAPTTRAASRSASGSGQAGWCIRKRSTASDHAAPSGAPPATAARYCASAARAAGRSRSPGGGRSSWVGRGMAGGYPIPNKT